MLIALPLLAQSHRGASVLAIPPNEVPPLSILTLSSSVNPSPAPFVERAGPGTGWGYLETARGTYAFSGLDGYVSQAESMNAPVLLTLFHFPTWANGTTNNATEPTDLYGSGTVSAPVAVACQGVLSGTTTTDCQLKEFMTALMQHECGVTSAPSTPLVGVCKIKYFETANEFNSNNYWVNSYQDWAQISYDEAGVIRQYCGDCQVIAGSTSAGGDGYNPAGGSAQYDQSLLTMLTDWGALPGFKAPDAVSFHSYAARTSVQPAPFPTTIVSDSSPLCNTTTANSSCRQSIATQVSNLRTTVLQNSAISSWAANLPIWLTEGGYGEEMQMGDMLNVSLSGNGTTVTATATHALPASWTTGTYIVMNGAAPSGFNDTSPVQITVTGTTTFTYANTTSGTSTTDGVALQVTSADEDTTATWNLRQAWVSQWIITQALQHPVSIMPYAYGDGCWMTMYGSGAHVSQCSTYPIIPTGNTPVQTALVQTLAWLVNTEFTSGLNETAETGGNVWTINLWHNGAFAQFAWWDGWQTTFNYNLFHGMTRAQNISGTVTTANTITLTNTPQLLY